MAESVADKRDGILRAASNVFAERGYHATGIADIARELGAGHGTFYRYFRNKEDIARNLVSRAQRQLLDAIADELPEASLTLEEYRAQVRRIGDKLFDVVVAEPDLARVLFYDAAAIGRADAGTGLAHDLLPSRHTGPRRTGRGSLHGMTRSPVRSVRPDGGRPAAASAMFTERAAEPHTNFKLQGLLSSAVRVVEEAHVSSHPLPPHSTGDQACVTVT